MTWRKNADGVAKHKQQVIQKDWFKENGYKQNCYPDDFYESINNELTPPRRAYWALAIDGDGTIFSKKHSLRVKIELTDREPIQFLADLYGASISRVQYSNRIWKDNYIITLFGKRCLHFLRLICPYMTEKRKHATQLINIFDPNYHPPKIPMNFRKYPELITTHMGMVAGLFETEGSVGIKVATTKYKSKTKGTRFYNSFNQWIHFTNTNLYPLRKIKRILESWPFIFKPKIQVRGVFDRELSRS